MENLGKYLSDIKIQLSDAIGFIRTVKRANSWDKTVTLAADRQLARWRGEDECDLEAHNDQEPILNTLYNQDMTITVSYKETHITQ